MRLKGFVALVTGLFFAGALAAQTPAAAVKPVTAAPPIDPENTLVLDLSTGGRVTVQLRPDIAPAHVERVKLLTRRGFYNGLLFHRVIEGFMAQTGDPNGTGEGGSELPDLKAEFNALPHVRGAISMARTNEPDSANSQFFIMLAPRLTLDRKYTGFGRVVSGMNFVDAIEKGEPPANPSRIVQASIGSDNLPAPAPGQVVARPPQPAPAAPPPAAAPAPAPVPAPAEAVPVPELPAATPAEAAPPAPAPASETAPPAEVAPTPAPEPAVPPQG